MKYWVLKSKLIDDGVLISALPEEGPKDFEYSEGVELAERHPKGSDADMYYDPAYPERIKLYDFLPNLSNVLLVSPRVKTVVESFNLNNVEFLPIWLMDHQNKLASKEYSILNVVGGEDIIDMEKSKVRMGRIIKDQVDRIKELVVDSERISKDAVIFRASKKLDEFFIRDDLKIALQKAGITGFKTISADGWNGRG